MTWDTRRMYRPPLMGDQSWRDDAACKDTTTPEVFFPERGEAVGPARVICEPCPVREECLEYAMVTHQNFGIWGGLSTRERRNLRARRRKGAA